MKRSFPLIVSLLASPAFAEDVRQLDAHEHGVGELNIAFDGNSVAMELHVPGADIVGFEHAAESAEHRAAIEAAVATLARPLDLFVLPEAAECTVTQAGAELEGEGPHEEHAAEDGHDDHAHEKHAEESHEDDAGHTEFHAEYLLTCGDPGAISDIAFAYFETFGNARELDVRIVTASGAQAFEVDRDAPTLDLRGMF